MGRRCQVCEHPDRAKIELGLARKVSVPQLARKFEVSQDALYRHRDKHMPPQLKASLMAAGRPTEIDLDELRRTESEGLLQHLVSQRGRLYSHVEQAADLGDLRAAAQIEGKITDNLQLESRLLGELVTHHQTTVNQLIVQPEYIQLRDELIRALRPYPEARRAVAQVLKKVEGAEPDFTGSPRQLEGTAQNAG